MYVRRGERKLGEEADKGKEDLPISDRRIGRILGRRVMSIPEKSRTFFSKIFPLFFLGGGGNVKCLWGGIISEIQSPESLRI